MCQTTASFSETRGGDKIDAISTKILETVERYNEAGEKIFFKKLVKELENVCCALTVHKKIKYLVNDGDLISVASPEHGTYKYLYIPGKEEVTDISAKLDCALKMLENILRKLR